MVEVVVEFVDDPLSTLLSVTIFWKGLQLNTHLLSHRMSTEVLDMRSFRFGHVQAQNEADSSRGIFSTDCIVVAVKLQGDSTCVCDAAMDMANTRPCCHTP